MGQLPSRAFPHPPYPARFWLELGVGLVESGLGLVWLALGLGLGLWFGLGGMLHKKENNMICYTLTRHQHRLQRALATRQNPAAHQS